MSPAVQERERVFWNKLQDVERQSCNNKTVAYLGIYNIL